MREIKKSFWDIITIIGTNIISIPVMIITESMQARILGPGDYGKVALTYSTISLLYLFGTSWLQTSIMRFSKEEFINKNNIRKSIGNILLLASVSFIISASLFILFKAAILSFLEIDHPFAVWIILFGFFIITAKQFVLETLKVLRLIKIQAFLNRFALKVLILVGILIIYIIKSDLGVNYIIFTFILADTIVLLLGLFFIKPRFIFPLRYDIQLLSKILKYSLPLIVASWSNFVINWVDAYVIKYYMTLADVGYYQAAYKILNFIKSFFGMTIVTIITPIIMVLKTDNRLNTINKIYLNRMMSQISFIAMLIVILIIMLSDYLFLAIYGPEFSDSIIPFKILMGAELFLIISAILTPIMTSFDMTKTLLFLGLTVGIFNLFADIILVQYFGIIGVSVASLLAVMIGTGIRLVAIKKMFRSMSFISLIFPLFTIILMMINIIDMGIIYRILTTISLIILISIWVKKMSIFHESDLVYFENINMPIFIKKTLTYVYTTFHS